MRTSRVLAWMTVGGLLLAPTALSAQSYRLRLDTRVQAVKYRGWQLDSIPVAEAVTGTNGGLFTASGFAVTCVAGGVSCTFYRPGAEQDGLPLVSTLDASVWGLGVPGLRLYGRARVGTDLADPGAWPGTAPAVQLVEGYVEYAQPAWSVRGGRLHEASRFGYTGFDGARAHARFLGGALTASAYGGWGLAWGTPLPITSDAVNPLGEFRPGQRQIVVGGDLAWAVRGARGRILYERQIDPGPDHLVAERVGGDVELSVVRNVTLSGGADYDLAFGEMGSAEATLAVAIPSAKTSVAVGGRRYRPYFELWSIWGAFSPVAYKAGFGSVTATPMPKLQLRARGELYGFDDPDAATPLAQIEDNGWRAGLGATYRHSADLIVMVDYSIDDGPGAGAIGIDGSVFWRPIPRLGLRGSVANLQRVLELRFNDADVWIYAFDADVDIRSEARLFGGVTYYDENRDRPDAAAFSWNQLRLHAGLRLAFGSGADRASLPAAILRIPEGGTQ
ncbi:MAG: hypothetical protein OER21_02610 [Gemmatimonadota bacterium]|nr:hypothetical protein [Gemmatimonadota bacterium]